MSRRYLVILSLIAAANVVACGRNTKGGGAVLSKTYATGGRTDRTANAAKGCLNLVDVVKTLSDEVDGVALHSRDYELGDVLPSRGSRLISFRNATDAATERLVAYRSLTGANAPTYVSTASGVELLVQKPAADLLGVDEQTACSKVKFKSGAEWSVAFADAQTLRLINPQTNETREYIHQTDNLVVNVFAPISINSCDGKPNPAKFERISTRITWGPSVGSVKLAGEYAKRLGLAQTGVSYLKFQSSMKTLSEKAEALNCGDGSRRPRAFVPPHAAPDANDDNMMSQMQSYR